MAVAENAAQWFQEQLASSAEVLIWSLGQVPPTRWHRPPPFGGWTPARHLFHLLYYEETSALPSMRQWQGASMTVPPPAGEELAWRRTHEVTALVEAFRAVRQEQVLLVSELAEADWDLPRGTLWGERTLRWVVTKTYQHTLDHANTLLQIALFWDDSLSRPAWA
jgi:hypothetical protein